MNYKLYTTLGYTEGMPAPPIPDRTLADAILILSAYERELSLMALAGVPCDEWHSAVRRTLAGLLVLVSAADVERTETDKKK